MADFDVPTIKTTLIMEELRPTGIKRQLFQRQAYDLRSHPRNYGIHGMEYDYAVTRGDCGVNFTVSTSWQLASVKVPFSRPYGVIAWHSPVALYEGHEAYETKCDYTHGPCFGDTSGLDGQALFDLVVADPEVLWPELEARLFKLEAQIAEQRALARNFS